MPQILKSDTIWSTSNHCINISTSFNFLHLNGFLNYIILLYMSWILMRHLKIKRWQSRLLEHLHLAPSHWAQCDETESPCNGVGDRSVTFLVLLCTEPQSSLMSLDTDRRTAEERRRETLFCINHSFSYIYILNCSLMSNYKVRL